MLKRLLLTLFFLGLIPHPGLLQATGEPMVAGVRIFYGPRTDLTPIDPALIASAQQRIDMTAYVLTERRVIEALIMAARRGVKVRLYLDPGESGRRPAQSSPIWSLIETPGVEARFKSPRRDLMHLKSYAIDGRILRTGSANFSNSGEKFQDNDLVIVENPQAALAFLQQFETLWARSDNAIYAAP
jgi:phosphatidylserine/phosphatidylglycerophosphate/cardiolipin synthase-like enzyme